APADRHRYRTARRHSQYHLRHLGLVRVRAVSAATRAAVPDHNLRRNPDSIDTLCGPALRHRRVHGPAPSRDHGPAVHYFHLTRRVRGGFPPPPRRHALAPPLPL